LAVDKKKGTEYKFSLRGQILKVLKKKGRAVKEGHSIKVREFGEQHESGRRRLKGDGQEKKRKLPFEKTVQRR